MRPSSVSRGALAALAVVLVGCLSCHSPDHSSTLSLDDLRRSSSSCPFPLNEALQDAGHKPRSAVSAAPRSTASSGTVLQQIDGTSAECSADTDAGKVSVFLIASTKKAAAAPVLLPLLADRAGIAQDALQSIASRIPKTESGDLVPLSGGNGHAALGIVTVDGARSAAFVLWGDDLSSSDVRAVAERLADRLD